MKTAPSPPETWQDYWEQDPFWSATDIWRVNAFLFAQNIAPSLKLSKEDSVLSIGCGTGSLETIIAPHVNDILAVDTSARFAQICSENTSHFGNVSSKVLGRDYSSLDGIHGQFSLFLCVSVIQYFKSPEEIENLLRSCLKLSKPGARILIGDLYLKKSPLIKYFDRIRSAWAGIKHRYFGSLIRMGLGFLMQGRSYWKFRNQNRELYLTRKEFEMIAKNLDLQIKWINDAVSIHHGRPSILLTQSQT